LVKVKICGVTNLEDARKACDYGADLLGFIFVEGTPRAVGSGTVRDIVTGLSGDHKDKIGKVGLFRNERPGEIAGIVSSCGLDHVQLHGDETPEECGSLKTVLEQEHHRQVKIIKVFKVKGKILPQGRYGLSDYEAADYFVFDTFHPKVPGGTGTRFDWEVLIKVKDSIEKPFFIAGGLTPENVSDAVRAVRPYGVDVSSGVESSPGKKDEKLLKEFIENAKKT
jgi:phosphoribosylanthranilate isomerase